MRLFLDTNVLVSALMGRGLCRDLLDRLILDHQVILGAPVHDELRRILSEKFQVPMSLWRMLDLRLREFEWASASDVPLDGYVPDPDDIPILACAVAAETDIIVTGDKALLALGRIQNIPIISPRDAWIKLTAPESEQKS